MKRITYSITEPTIVEDEIENDCTFENSFIEGSATIIIDEEFIKEMKLIANDIEKNSQHLIQMFENVHKAVCNYFSSSEVNKKSRKETYYELTVCDENGQAIGTKISSLKGKNISMCSEKSVAAYIILEELFSRGIIARKPALVLSKLSTESKEAEPHAFVMINKESPEETFKHLLFDVENPTKVEYKNGENYTVIGLYSLTDGEYEDFLNGLGCIPKSIYEVSGEYREISEKRIYGNNQENIVKK
jgi:hypothetical protein